MKMTKKAKATMPNTVKAHMQHHHVARHSAKEMVRRHAVAQTMNQGQMPPQEMTNGMAGDSMGQDMGNSQMMGQ